jgi:hypothetical protein
VYSDLRLKIRTRKGQRGTFALSIAKARGKCLKTNSNNSKAKEATGEAFFLKKQQKKKQQKKVRIKTNKKIKCKSCKRNKIKYTVRPFAVLSKDYIKHCMLKKYQ